MRKISFLFWQSRTRAAFLPAAGVLVFLCSLPALFCQQTAQGDIPNEPPADPVPLRRMLLSPDRLLPELERVKRGQLLRLPREEFEKRVQQAGLAGEALKHPPRLVESRYRAVLVDSALEGSGEWKIINPGPGAGILAVEPLGIALRQVRWPDNQEAILGDLDGDGPRDLEVLVEPAGERSLFIEWSARSNPAPGGLRFSLEVPACAVATLDLDLPDDHELSASRDLYLVSGPHPAAAANRRTWRVSFAGRSQINLVVQFRNAGLPAPLVVSRQQTRQEVSPGQLQADYEFDLEVLHSGVKELRCECDAVLRPTEVNIRNLEGWELRAGGGNNPSTLFIRLREPFRAGKLQVRCLAALPADKTWTSPGLRLTDAVSRGESLLLRIHPEVQLEDWKPAGFRLTQSAFSPDGWHELTLRAGLDAGPNPERPSGRLQAPRSEYKVRQVGWWQVGPSRTALTVYLTYEVSRGRLFQLPIQLPAGWTVEHVDLAPVGLLRHWTVAPEKGKPTLVVDLHRALGPAAPAVLTVQARPSQPMAIPFGGTSVPFPDLVPLGARLRYGGLGISVASIYQPNVTASAPAAAPDFAEDAESGEARPRPASVPRARPPWGKQPPDYYFPFLGQTVEGTLHVRPRPTRLRARCTSDVVVASGRVVNLIRLELHPDIGTPDHADLFVFGPPPGAWEWQTVRGNNRVRSVERLPARENASRLAALASRQPLQAIALAALPPPHGSWWRLALTRPLTEPLILETRVELPGRGSLVDRAAKLLPLGSTHPLGVLALASVCRHTSGAAKMEGRWEVPLVTVPAAERLDGRVTLHLAGSDLVRVKARGLQEVGTAVPQAAPAGPAPSASSSWRAFQYAQLPMALALDGRPPAADRSAAVTVDGARLTTYLEPSGRLLHHYRFRVWNWRQQTVPLALPPKARLLAARTDGRWLSRMIPSRAEDGCPSVELPVIAERILHHFEVIYATDPPAWSLWSRLEAPAPSPPIRGVALERTWCLPRDVLPANPTRFQRLPVPTTLSATDIALPFAAPAAADWAVRQEQSLSEAAARLRKQFHAGDQVRLDRLLEALGFDQLKERTLLVLDTQALRGAILLPSTRVRVGAETAGKGSGPAPWEALGIVYVPCRAAPLLTTRRQLSTWTNGSAAFEEDVADAVAFGHDASGRFRTVADWLHGAEDEPGADATTSGIRSPVELPDGATAWRPLAGYARAEQLTVVRPRVLPLLGLVLAAVLGWAAIRLGRRLPERPARRLLLLWLALGGLALLWLPPPLRPLAWWPELVAAGIALAWCVSLGLARVPGVRGGSPSTVIAGSAALACLVGIAGQAAAPGPATVYLIPEGDGKKQTVLAPAELLDRLQTLAQRGVPGLRGAVLLGATYEGRADEDTARFEARFPVHCFGDGPAVLTLPLGGIQLTEAMLDGAPAHPAALPSPREGYTLEVKGRGSHHVVLRFAVPINRTNDDRDLRLTIPELPRSRLTLEVPASAGYLHAAEARGSQHVRTDAKAVRLEADLGSLATLRAHWRRDAHKPRPAVVSVREAYYWDLQVSSARLLAILHYTVNKGWTSRLVLDLPAAIEVVSVEAGSVPGAPAAPRLKEWRLKKEGGGRRLLLEFQAPVTAEVQVTLELVPRQPFGRSAPLIFPTPLEAQPARGFLAYHVAGLDANVDQYHAITGIDRKLVADTFAGSFGKPWRAARQEDLPVPTRAYWRGRDGNLRLTLDQPAAQIRCRQELLWRVKPRQASLIATAQLAAADGNLALVEWNVPANLVVTEVSGPHVRGWTRGAGRVQVWLAKPVAETTLQLNGWLPRPAKEAQRFDVPHVRIGNRPQSTTLRVLAGEGVTLAPEAPRNLTAKPEQGVAGREWVYTTETANYGLRFQTNSAAANTRFRLLTFTEVRNRQLTFVTTIQCQIQRGDLRSLTVVLRNWEGSEVVLDAPAVARRREQRLDAGGRSWVLDLKSGITDQYRLTLTGSVPLGTATEILMPDVRVETPGLGPLAQERWVAVAGQELAGESISGLQSVAALGALKGWQGEIERLRRAGGRVWQVTADDWRLRLRPRAPAARTVPIQVFLTEHALAVVDGRRWTHQVTYWLYHEAGADLGVVLPQGASMQSVAIDGSKIAPLPPDTERLWLPLPGGSGSRVVRISWTFGDGKEPIDAPSLACPRLDGIAEGPTVWTLHVPPGYELARGLTARVAGKTVSTGAAGLDLWRAAAQLRLLGRLQERSRDAGDHVFDPRTAAVRERLERWCRQAEYQLSQPGVAVGPGPNGQSAAAWLQELRDEYRRLAPAEQLRPAAPTTTLSMGEPSALASLQAGRPVYWQAAGDAVPPRVSLVSRPSEAARHTLALSALLLVLLLAVWILARFFKAGSWPEQLIVLGILGLLLFGPVVGRLFLLLPLAGVAVRLTHLIAWLRTLWPYRKGQTETTATGP